MRRALLELIALSLDTRDTAAAARAGRRRRAIAEVLDALDACCFGTGPAPDAAAVTRAARSLPRPRRRRRDAALPPLYALEG